MGAPLRPHARERHGDLPPPCWHLGGGWRRGRRGPSLPTPLARASCCGFSSCSPERCFTPPADMSVTIVASEHEPDPDVDRRALGAPGRGDRQRVGAAVLPGEPEPAPRGGVPAV